MLNSVPVPRYWYWITFVAYKDYYLVDRCLKPNRRDLPHSLPFTCFIVGLIFITWLQVSRNLTILYELYQIQFFVVVKLCTYMHGINAFVSPKVFILFGTSIGTKPDPPTDQGFKIKTINNSYMRVMPKFFISVWVVHQSFP